MEMTEEMFETCKQRWKDEVAIALAHCGQKYIDLAWAEIDKGNTNIVRLIQPMTWVIYQKSQGDNDLSKAQVPNNRGIAD